MEGHDYGSNSTEFRGVETDLSELTSGEKAFIGLLFMPITTDIVYTQRVVIGGAVSRVNYGYDFVYNMSLDLSKITRVDIVPCGATDGLVVYWADVSGNPIVNINNYGSVPVPSGAKGLIILNDHVFNMHFQITSFTTADGKVHTADNLNY